MLNMNMNTPEEWKSLWAVSSVHAAPLLLSPTTTKEEIGPLIFNPSREPQTHHHIFTLPSTSSIFTSIVNTISPKLKLFLSNPEQLAQNSLQLLRCPGTDSTLAFFPTGCNSDQVGFVLLSVGESGLTVDGEYGETEVLSSSEDEDALTHRIVEISVSPLADCLYTSGESSESVIGYLLVSTTMSVYYYKISIIKEYSGNITPRLELVDNKLFKSSIVVHACWSPHIAEESLVLLGNGDLFLFELDCFSTPSQRLTRKKVKVSWEKYIDFEQGGWLSCDFSWHSRIMVVVHTSTVFIVDTRYENYIITPLLKVGTGPATNDRFLAFSIAGLDRFYCTLASKDMLFLCDTRKPMMPILRWAHNVVNPSYVFVSSLSELRSLSEDVSYSWASEEGYGIILGSFWNCEFSLFCYGPKPRSSSLYAWGLPSDISLDSHECGCGSCLVKQVFSKEQLPIWINWQQKKDFVLGFGILDKDISSQLFKPDEFGGFTFIMLTSSGNLELHRYRASWDYSEEGHVEQAFDLEDSVFYETVEEGHKNRMHTQYVKLKWLDGYLNSDLDRIVSTELYANHNNETPGKASFGSEFHQLICENLKTYSSGGPDSDGTMNIYDVLKDVSLPTSIHEIALRSMWSSLPKKVLRLGFSTYSDLPNVPVKLKNLPLEFLEVPCQQPHLPPFFFRDPSSRSSKWSEKHKPSDHLVGPVTPLPLLIAYRKTLMLTADNRPADSEIDLECDKVLKVLDGVIGSESQMCIDQTISLADDNEDVLHSSAFEDEKHSNDQTLSEQFSSYKTRVMIDDSSFEDEKHSNLIFGIGDKDVKEPFESDCLVKFKFEEKNLSLGSDKSFMLFKKQYSMFKKDFESYKNYVTESNIRR